MPTCKDCLYCLGQDEISGYYICEICGELEAVEPCVAEDEHLGCDLYVKDCNDDTSA